MTLGFGEILPQIARNGDNFFGTGFNLTNGPNGITPLDSPGFGNRHLGPDRRLPARELPPMLQREPSRPPDPVDRRLLLDRDRALLFTVFCSFRLQFSRLGRAWIAIREDETAAAAMGVPLMRTKTWAYASGAFFGGVAGAFYASFKSNTFPGDFYFNISVFILCMVILGGMGNIWGVDRRRSVPRVPERLRPRHDRAVGEHAHPRRELAPEHRRPAVRRRASTARSSWS